MVEKMLCSNRFELLEAVQGAVEESRGAVWRDSRVRRLSVSESRPGNWLLQASFLVG